MRKKNNVMQQGYYIVLIIGGILFVMGTIIAAAVGLVNLLADIHTLFVQRSNFWI
jgi:hypothetical protein